MSEDDYESLLETLELPSTPGVLKGVRKAKQEIEKGQTYSLDKQKGSGVFSNGTLWFIDSSTKAGVLFITALATTDQDRVACSS